MNEYPRKLWFPSFETGDIFRESRFPVPRMDVDHDRACCKNLNSCQALKYQNVTILWLLGTDARAAEGREQGATRPGPSNLKGLLIREKAYKWARPHQNWGEGIKGQFLFLSCKRTVHKLDSKRAYCKHWNGLWTRLRTGPSISTFVFYKNFSLYINTISGVVHLMVVCYLITKRVVKM